MTRRKPWFDDKVGGLDVRELRAFPSRCGQHPLLGREQRPVHLLQLRSPLLIAGWFVRTSAVVTIAASFAMADSQPN
jgi:hypothetical protein